ncbi:adenylate cyclase associated N terminal-domain-containing protein [Daldinia decipiens]|uniref:adenylate cyclase associated N terminal-domain-containing protein n=1 Tax=Daldinia decipiens TaxID=326647 RepID=UPI0020C45FE5|nr:adenylate cyclase associated N terminal-domain-containing protein [Daldinia decipiens]KAI1656702.1 adenylate cyclase associated N terminal-domain-containing protein [Daldinia decipiens]
MAQNHIHNLVTLIKRLEAATTRLEDIASSTIELPQAVPALTATVATPSNTSSPTPQQAISAPASSAPVQVPQEPLPESIEEFDAFIDRSVDKYVKASNKLGGLVAEQASKVLEGFKQQRRFLLISTKAKKPDITGSEMVVYQELLKPINEALMAVGSIKESNRGSAVFSQLSAVSEGIMVLAWVTVENRPFKHVEESLGSAQFFGNRVIKEHKEKDADQVEWIQSFYQVFRDLADYVKQYFPNGIPWNPSGQPASEIAKSLESAPVVGVVAPPPPPPPVAGGAPPPPPPGPPPVLQIKDQAATSKPEGMGAVFSELNKGESVTKGLRKVDRSEMTHKNPALRASSTVSDSSARGKSPAPGKKPKPESMRLKKPPKKELDGNKWLIENFDKHPEPIEIEAEMSHSILISRCNQTTIIIKGKANAVTVENTQRLSIVIDSLVSTVDVVKSSNFALQVLGTLPTVLLDQLDGAQIYLSKESSSTRVFSSKSSGININIVAGPDDDYKEIPLPGQICSYYDEAKGDMVNEIVDHAG